MSTEKRLIEADALKDNFSFLRKMWSETEICAVIDNAPTVNAVVHGYWDEIPNKYMSVSTKKGSYSGHATSCSVCHEVNPNAFKTNYCPNCGVKMDGGAE